MRLRIPPSILALLGLSAPVWAAEDLTLASPDGRVQLRLSAGKGQLEYSVTFREKPVIETSALGITVDKVNLAEGVQLGKVDRYQVKESYPWYGGHSTAVDHCHGVRVTVTHAASLTGYTLEIHAYNDGIAFRHIVPGQGTRVPDEATMFRLPSGSTLWYHDLEDHYDGVGPAGFIAMDGCIPRQPFSGVFNRGPRYKEAEYADNFRKMAAARMPVTINLRITQDVTRRQPFFDPRCLAIMKAVREAVQA